MNSTTINLIECKQIRNFLVENKSSLPRENLEELAIAFANLTCKLFEDKQDIESYIEELVEIRGRSV